MKLKVSDGGQGGRPITRLLQCDRQAQRGLIDRRGRARFRDHTPVEGRGAIELARCAIRACQRGPEISEFTDRATTKQLVGARKIGGSNVTVHGKSKRRRLDRIGTGRNIFPGPRARSVLAACRKQARAQHQSLERHVGARGRDLSIECRQCLGVLASLPQPDDVGINRLRESSVIDS